MITCPACGKENDEVAFECKRCRAPLREEVPEEHGYGQPADAGSKGSLGEVCRRCETFNAPGVQRCTTCGYPLLQGAAPAAMAREAQVPASSPAPAPARAFTPPSETPSGKPASMTQELSALALSDQEAAEAGLSIGDGSDPSDRTPPDPWAVPSEQPAARPKSADLGAEAAGAPGTALASRRVPAIEPPPPPPTFKPGKAEPAAAPAEKPCANCGALNPPAAKFCFDCGTPFARKGPAAEPAKAPQSVRVSSSIQIADDLAGPTAESAPLAADSVAERLPDPPFRASLVIEKGAPPGAAFALLQLETSLGSTGTHIELLDDPFIAPHAATVAFADDRLVLRDEGSVNGVFVKVRESARLEPGDLFVAGQRLLRYDGSTELPPVAEGDTPVLGTPRPRGTPVRVTEVLAGGKTGRTCHRAGPVAIGRTGCDMNFPSDALLAPRHAEVRLGEDGTATLVDLGTGRTGVFLRVRQQQHPLEAGDVVMVGDQQLRVDLG